MIVLVVGSNFIGITAIMSRGKKIKRMYFFLLHLCVADLLTALTSLLPELIWTVTSSPIFYGGDALCRIGKYIQMIAPNLRLVVGIYQSLYPYKCIYKTINNYDCFLLSWLAHTY